MGNPTELDGIKQKTERKKENQKSKTLLARLPSMGRTGAPKPSKKERLALKREEAKLAKERTAKAAAKDDAETEDEIADRLKRANEAVWSLQEKLDALIEKLTVSEDVAEYVEKGRNGYFKGEGSTALNEILTRKRREIGTASQAVSKLRNKLLIARYGYNPYARPSLWKKSEVATVKTKEPMDVAPGVIVVERVAVGTMLEPDGGWYPKNQRCYHTLDGESVECDCSRPWKSGFALSDLAHSLRDGGLLVVDDFVITDQDIILNGSEEGMTWNPWNSYAERMEARVKEKTGE
jgi:hypothetical protein